ncbi:MAG: DUF2779 domain-containing protein [Gammaproteobacteria bacterium]|nr:DUF2779 domain-containing protein [Gammaproteobacteria bacterium]
MHLTKSAVLAGLQCDKRLFLLLNRPELAKTRHSPLAQSGIEVGKLARTTVSDGVLVDRFGADAQPYDQTQALVNDPQVNAIFEAGFRYQDTDVFVDILERDGDSWNLIEVKSSSSIKDTYIDDVSVQYLVVAGTGVAISRVELMILNRNLIYRTNQGYDGLFIREDVTDRVIVHSHLLADRIAQLRQNMTSTEPERHVDGHCNKPFPCEFKSYCEQQDGDYPVSALPNAAKAIQMLYANGIYDIRNIPAGMLSSETHIRVHRATLTGQAELDDEAARVLNRLDYPRYYLDFEAINLAIPRWDNSRPNQQHPFQWSCHIQYQDGTLAHEDFLDVSGFDPRRKFAESLIAVCGHSGPVIVYNQQFEKGIIKSLAIQSSDLSDALLALNQRIFDLLPVVKKYYYHPHMKGSWSIKKVLPCLLPDLHYSDLGAVQDGLMAQSAYLDITAGRSSTEQTEALSADLREYCKLDTYAMVAIVDRLCELSRHQATT